MIFYISVISNDVKPDYLTVKTSNFQQKNQEHLWEFLIQLKLHITNFTKVVKEIPALNDIKNSAKDALEFVSE